MKKFLLLTLFLVGCSHPVAPITIAPAVDSISVIQGNLSAVDGKEVIVENWIKSHK